MGKLLMIALTCVALASACGRERPGPEAAALVYKTQTLASGKQIRAISTEVKNFPDNTPGLMLKYETDLKVEDIPAIRQEVSEVWESFRPQVESADYKRAVVSVQGVAAGGSVKGYQYQFERAEDNQWRPYRQR